MMKDSHKYSTQGFCFIQCTYCGLSTPKYDLSRRDESAEQLVLSTWNRRDISVIEESHKIAETHFEDDYFI